MKGLGSFIVYNFLLFVNMVRIVWLSFLNWYPQGSVSSLNAHRESVFGKLQRINKLFLSVFEISFLEVGFMNSLIGNDRSSI